MDSSNSDELRPLRSRWIWPVVILCFLLLVPLETYLVLRWTSGSTPPPETQTSSRVAFQGHHYEIFRHKRTWDEAKRLCEAMGGHLVCITSEAEQEFVLSQILQIPH